MRAYAHVWFCMHLFWRNSSNGLHFTWFSIYFFFIFLCLLLACMIRGYFRMETESWTLNVTINYYSHKLKNFYLKKMLKSINTKQNQKKKLDRYIELHACERIMVHDWSMNLKSKITRKQTINAVSFHLNFQNT